MITVFFHWVLLWISLPLTGYLACKIFDKKDNSLDYFKYLWIGYACLTGFLQILSFFLPMQSYVVLVGWIFINLVGGYLILRQKRKFDLAKLWVVIRKYPKFLLFMIVTIVIGLYSSTREVEHYDTYLYHFNMVSWNRNYPVVPGLANLHERLGFNSSFHLVASFVERFVNPGYSVFILNGFLVVSLILYFYKLSTQESESKFVRIFTRLMIPYIFLRLLSGEASSLSSDLAVSVFSIVFLTAMLQNQQSRIQTLTMALLLPTIKLSGIMAPVIALVWCRVQKIQLPKLLISSLVGIMILLSFFGRNLVISGYPLFPSTILGIAVDWSVPPANARILSNTVTAWARMPGADYLKSLSSYYWLNPWWLSVRNSLEVKFLFFAILCLFVFGRKLATLDKNKYLLLFTYCMLSISLILVMAPDLRFGSVYFYMLGIGTLAAIININILDFNSQIKLTNFVVTYYLAFAVATQLAIYRFPPMIEFPVQIRQVALEQVKLTDESQIYLPENGDQCGNGPIPCTYYQPNIQMRMKNNLAKGFRYE